VTSGLAVLIAALAVATAFGLWRRRVDGAVREVDAEAHAVPEHRDVPEEQLLHLQPADLGAELGEQATLVQFSSAFCQPCRATRQVLGQVSEMVPGVAHVEVDAEEHLDLVRRLHVMRTPTVFVLDGSGAIRNRASGTPRKADIIGALGEFVSTGENK
jgi:thiol-disulfide isomerase/thioredoxin